MLQRDAQFLVKKLGEAMRMHHDVLPNLRENSDEFQLNQ